MVDVKHPKCQHVDENGNKCDKGPTYGPEGGKAIYCEPHSNLYENMVMVITNRLCKYVDEDGNKCGSCASFNLPGNKSGKWCKKHKGPNDEFVLSAIYCEIENCKKRASQNYKNEKKPRFCEDHRLIGMCNIVDPRCEVEECVKMATHAFTDGKKRRCAEHKLEGMKDVRSKKCAYEGCESQPTYNVPGGIGRMYCAKHANKHTMNNVKCYRCKHRYTLSDGTEYACDTQIRDIKQYDGYCAKCFMILFPNKHRSKNLKHKEVTVLIHVQNTFPHIPIKYDKQIKYADSKYRPDICIYMNDYTIMIEIDERQHIHYDDEYENKRTIKMFNDLGCKPLIIIRFNPDHYKTSDKIVESCWYNIAGGSYVLRPDMLDDWNSRLQKLNETLQYYLHNPPTKELEVIYLYYDECKKKEAIEDDDNIIIA
jgi:hypothetical protein